MTRPAAEPTRPKVWKRRLGTSAGVFLGLVFLVAAWGKLLDPALFAEQIEIEGLDFLLPAAAVALIAIGLEIALGTALVLGLRRLWVLLPTAALTAFFLFLTGRHYVNDLRGIIDESVACGCFGNLVIRTPAEAFWQDLLLLLPALLLAFLGRGATEAEEKGSAETVFPSRRMVVVLVVTVLGLAFTWLASELPLDNLATRLRPGVGVADLCSGRNEERLCVDLVIPELTTGEHLVVLADLADPAFGESVDGLNTLALEYSGNLWVLTDATADEQYAFFWQWGPAFEIREAPHALLRPLYRWLPRSFIVQDGEVIETLSGLPPEVDG